MAVRIKRVYDPAARSDGWRVLVDRLWPRGVSKERADIALWCKDVSPSTELRDWYHADKETRFKEFSTKYHTELKALPSSVWEPFMGHTTVTLITAVKDIEHSHIPTLNAFLQRRMKYARELD